VSRVPEAARPLVGVENLEAVVIDLTIRCVPPSVTAQMRQETF
jgi:hypothetical protein